MAWFKTFVLLLIISSVLGTLYTIDIAANEGSGKGVVAVNYDNYNEVVKYLAGREHVDLSNKTMYYNLLYGGRPIEIRYPSPLHERLLGISSRQIHFAAYINGRGWVELPFIPYSLYMNAVGGDYYRIDRIIGRNTVIKLRLPPYLPSKADPRKIVPDFARGSRGWFVIRIEVERGISIPVYVFLYSHLENSRIHSYMVLTNVFTEWDTAFEAPGLNLVLKYVRKNAVKVKDLSALARNVYRRPIEYSGIDIDFACPPNNPTCNLPDGGGGPPTSPKLEYVEVWPTVIPPNPVSENPPLYQRMHTNDTVTFYIRPVDMYNGYWSTVSPRIIEIGLTITITPEEEVDENQILMVFAFGKYLGYGSIAGYDTSVLSFRGICSVEGGDLNDTWDISVEIIGETRIRWRFTMRAYLVYELDEKFYRDSYKSLFLLTPFYETSDPATYNRIVLRRGSNYTYKYTIPIPLPNGGYFANYTKLFYSRGLNLTLNLQALTPISTPYRFRVMACLGAWCSGSTVYIAGGAPSQLDLSVEAGQWLAEEIIDDVKSTGSIPVALSIEPVDVPQEDRIDIAVWASNMFPAVLNVVPPSDLLSSADEGWITISTLYGKRDTLLYGTLKDVISSVVTAQRVVAEGSINRFYPTLFNVKYDISSIHRGSGGSFIYVEIKPFIPVWSTDPPCSGNFYTEYDLAGITEIDFTVKLEDAAFSSDFSKAYDYDPGVGAYLPDEKDLLTRIGTVVQIGEKVARYISRSAQEFLRNLQGMISYASIVAYGYDVLRQSLLNGVSITANGDTLAVSYTVSPLNPLPKDRGLVVKADMGYSYGGSERSYVNTVFTACIRTRAQPNVNAGYHLYAAHQIPLVR